MTELDIYRNNFIEKLNVDVKRTVKKRTWKEAAALKLFCQKILTETDITQNKLANYLGYKQCTISKSLRLSYLKNKHIERVNKKLNQCENTPHLTT